MRHCVRPSTGKDGTGKASHLFPKAAWLALLLVSLATLLLPMSALGASGTDNGAGNDIKAFVTPSLLAGAQADPNKSFDVIVQGAAGNSSNAVAADVLAENNSAAPKRFSSVAGVEAQLSGKQLLRLARKNSIYAITPNAPVSLSGSTLLTNPQIWPYASDDAKFWPDVSAGLVNPPAIAIVDSGIDASRPDVAGRVREQVTMTSLPNNSPSDGRGHGTFVASIAAGSALGYAGVAPSAPLVSIDVADDSGMAMTSDVISAADWILANKTRLNIRVANFSLQASNPGSFLFDPLNKAVERLWFGGVVVVAAAGNYGELGRGVPFAPADDPFVITVGASDVNGSTGPGNDFAAPWSAYGYTLDGFSKPELGAPGRYMIGAVPLNATLASERPTSVVAPGYMQLSGTSFAAPVVSGAAAMVLAYHPNWTPDQVKGALMLTTRSTNAVPQSLGVGEVDGAKAAQVVDPPNPNLALDSFVGTDPAGGSLPVFNTASWTSAATANPAWMSASWTSAAWTSASWTSASWTSAAWTSAAWTSASWTSASWTSVLSNADSTDNSGGEYASPDEIAQAELDMGVDLNGDGFIGPVTTTPQTSP